MALGCRFLELKEKIIHFFTLECFSRYSIGPIVKIYGTIATAKYKTIFEDNVLSFAEDTMAPGWNLPYENDSKLRFSVILGVIKNLLGCLKFCCSLFSVAFRSRPCIGSRYTAFVSF